MLGFKYSDFAFICATLLLAATCILGQQLQYRKPWPTYSLQNMPQTRFTCHDKILGGYYADAETQCQMFHVCVKVAGVGVQDFRFLCPNGTAFDQEAQICADWGDVDCEASVLYYGSDNFDLYRLGSGFESKRAPLAEEEESTFHLQRAESADIRRSKETRVDQQSRPDQPPNYTKRFEATPRNTFNSFANSNGNSHSLSHNNNQNQRNSDSQTPSDARPAGDVPKRPIVNYYTPTSSTTPSSYSSSTTSTTTERYSNDESKLEYDDIFKGSHSSHFFANRNGGREDDFVDHPSKSKYNDFTEYNNNKKSTITSTTGKTRAPQPTRSKRIQIVSSTSSGSSSSSAAPTKSPTPPTPKFNKKITLFAAYNTTKLEQPKPHTSPATSVAAIGGSSTTRPSYITVNRFNLNANDYHTQERIEPTTYNPAYNLYRLKSTTPKYTDLSRDIGPVRGKATSSPTALPYESTKGYNKPTATARKAQKLERTQQKLAARGNATTFVSPNELTDFAKVKPLQQAPQPFQAPQTTRISNSTSNEPQYYRVRNGGEQPQRVGRLDPAPFSGATRQRSTSTTASTSKPRTSVNPELRPRGSANRGSINYKATTQQGGAELYAAITSSTKKFSTLVAKDQYSAYTPTTFKPTTFKPTSFQKSYDNFHYNVQQQPTVRLSSKQPNFEPSSTAVPNTANPYYNADEDDGQYHPELYEVDFPRNRFNLQRSSTGTASTTTTTTTSTPRPYNAYNTFDNPQKHLQTQQQSAFRKQAVEQAVPVDLSEEDELFKTAHSLNFGAASINKLRVDIFKAEKNSQQYNSQYSPSLEQSTSTSGTSPKPSTTMPRPTSSTTYRTTTPSTTYDYFTYSTTASTQRAYSSSAAVPSITTAAPTRRTTTYGTTAAPPPPPPPLSKSSKPSKHGKLAGKGKSKKSKPASKRPPHADEDTSYDYAYYDTDTLSESPQQYPDYEIAEFVKTRKN